MNNSNRGPLATSVDRAVSWIGWHIGELAGVTVPGVVALSVTPWAAVVSGIVGAGWLAHEIRLARQDAAIKARPDAPALEAAKSKRTPVRRRTRQPVGVVPDDLA